MFKNANNHLIKPLTGSVNTCSLIASRYILKRQLEGFEVKDGYLKAYIEDLRHDNMPPTNFIKIETKKLTRIRSYKKMPAEKLFYSSLQKN